MEKVMFRINGNDFLIKEILNKIDPTFPFRVDVCKCNGSWLNLKIFCGLDNGDLKILTYTSRPGGCMGDDDFVILGRYV